MFISPPKSPRAPGAKSPRSPLSKKKSAFQLANSLEAEDRKQLDMFLKDDSLREPIESVWYTLLSHGEALVQQKCDISRFKLFAKNCGLDVGVALSNFDMVNTSGDMMDFSCFVRVLFHTGKHKANTQDYVAGIKALMPLLTSYDSLERSRHDLSPLAPSENFLSISELDRILYIYDGVFGRLFQVYCNLDKHQHRELTFDQMKILDEYIELDEFKEFCKDFGLFPKIVSHVEISKACQCASWGSVFIDPQKQTGIRPQNTEKSSSSKKGKDYQREESIISKKEGKSLLRTPPGPGPIEDPGPSPPIPLALAANPLVLAALPEDMQSEILLDKTHFMDALIRLSQMMCTKPSDRRMQPTLMARFEYLLRTLEVPYEKMFHKKMIQDCDFVEPGIPMLLNASPSAALAPTSGTLGQTFDLSISGANFCEKRPVFTRFGGESSDIIVKCSSVTNKRVIVPVPNNLKATSVHIEVSFNKVYTVHFSKFTDVRIECSNNRFAFSETDPEQVLHLSLPSSSFVIEEAVCAKLLTHFAMMCSQDDKYNTRLMNREKWKRFKKAFGVVESLNNTRSNGKADDPYYLNVAESRGAKGDLNVDFRGFLRVLTRCLYEMVVCEDKLIYPKLVEIANREAALRHKKVEEQAVPEDDMALTRQIIEQTEQRSIRQYDVYNGPVLCGRLCDRPGLITLRNGSTRRHPYLTYEHYDINSQQEIMFQISMSESFDHVVSRVLSCGFDIGAPAESLATRKPYGRCWSIHRQHEKIGVLWDYPGNFAGTTWLPVAVEAAHEQFCITVYLPHTSPDFVVVYMLFSRAKDISHLRTSLIGKQYSLTTQLYKS